MSYLTRLSARVAGPHAMSSTVMPKGINNRQSPVIARAEETGEEDETLSPMRTSFTHLVRRQEEEEEEEAQRALEDKEMETEAQRQAQEEEEEEEELAPLRRQEEEEEEELAALRRQETVDEEELAPLRRQAEEEEEEELQPMRAIARQEEVPLEDTGENTPPSQASLEPGAEPVSQEFASEEEPSNLQALHRDMSPGLPQSHQQVQAVSPQSETSNHQSVSDHPMETSVPPHLMVSGFTDRNTLSNSPPQRSGSEDSRTNVVIDQLDVLIHEQPLPAERNESRRSNHDRAFRARYLRRL